MPKVSAVMALYNTPYEYLTATVESILSQTLKDFEFIIIDDGSSIEYKDFFEKFNDGRIKYFKLEKNSGPGHARNEGIKKAQGKYVAIVDSDDVYLPQRLEIQAKFLDENPEISLTGCSFRFSNRKRPAETIYDDKEARNFILFNSPLCNPTVMFKREEFAQKNLFYSEDINFAEDYELWINALFVGVKMANLKELLMTYTRRPGQLSKERAEKQITVLKNLYKKMFLKLGFEASQEELDLHYDIYSEKFSQIKSSEKISSWFDKIILHNTANIFDNDLLILKKEQVLKSCERIKNRLFKIKIGGYNFCINKNLKIHIEQRS